MSRRIQIFLAIVGLAWLLVFLVSLLFSSAWQTNTEILFKLLGVSGLIVGILGVVMSGILVLLGFFRDEPSSLPKDTPDNVAFDQTTENLPRSPQIAGLAYPQAPSESSLDLTYGAMLNQRSLDYIHRGEIEDSCRALLRDIKAAAIVGATSPGGIGKTELAIQASNELTTGGIFSRRIWVDCGERTPNDVLMDMLHQCDLDVPPGTDQTDKIAYLKGFLADKHWLVVLDDIRSANASVLTDLLPLSTTCAALVTSRIEQLPAPLVVLQLGAMTEAECLRLLKVKLQRLVKWDIEKEGSEALIRACAFNPLALLIASNLIAGRPPAQRGFGAFVEEITASIQHLPIPLDDTREALFGVFETSYDELSELDQRRFCALASFHPTGFTTEAAAAIWGDELRAAGEAIERMRRLSLLRLCQSETERFRMHDLLHEFAELKLKASGEEITFRAIHAAHYASILGRANQIFGRGGDSPRLALRLYDTESPNILAGQAWAATHIDDSTVAAEACNWYAWQASINCSRLNAAERVRWIESGLAASIRLGNKVAETAHLNNLGSTYADLGEPRKSIQLYKRALALDRTTGNRRGEGNALHNLGNAYVALGEPRKAIQFYEQRLAIARETKNIRGELSALENLGRAYVALGEPRKAIQFYEQHLAMTRKAGDRQSEAADLNNLGSAYSVLGEPREARKLIEQQLVIVREMGDRHAEAAALGILANTYADQGETREAIPLYQRQLIFDQEIGDRRDQGKVLANIGNAHADLGEARAAIPYYEEALVIDREMGDRRGEGAVLGNLGLAYAALGETRRAIQFYEQALGINQMIGDRRSEGAMLGNLGNAYSDLGEPRKANLFYEQHLAIAREIGDRRGEGNALGNMGNAHGDMGDLPEAIRLHEQHLAIAREIGDRRGEGAALGNLGLMRAALGEPREALQLYEQHLAIAREIGDRRDEGNVLANIGNAHADLGETRAAIPYHEQALAIDREIGDRRSEAIASWNLGLAYEKQGQLGKAIEVMQVCLDFEQEIGHPDAEKDAAHIDALRRKRLVWSEPLKEYLILWTSKARSLVMGKATLK